MNMEFTSIKDVASKIYSHSLMRDLPFDRIIEDTLELIQITGCPTLFEDKEATIEIHNYRGALPCDYFDMYQVLLDDVHSPHPKAFKYTTSTFSPVGSKPGVNLVYKIQGNIIYTSIKEGNIRISYKAIKLDSDGYPMIVNNASFLRALRAYIKLNWFTDLFDQGKINAQVLANAQTDYMTYIAQAQNSLIMPTIDQMESISRIMNDAMTRQYEHSNTFDDINKSHIIRIQ